MVDRIETPRRSSQRGQYVQPAAKRRRRFGLGRYVPVAFEWRWVSGGLVVVLGLLLAFSFTSPAFYVTRVEVGGIRHVPAEEIFADSDVAGYHVFWLDPETIAARIATSSSIESAAVTLHWPARVVIRVQEREPALVWEQAGVLYWVDVNGNLMRYRRALPSLVRVVNQSDTVPFTCSEPGCPDGSTARIDPVVVLGAQHLKTLRSNIEVLYYDPVGGLSYQDGRGWRVFFGVGANMDRKLLIYEALVEDLQARGIRPLYINVSNPGAPFYKGTTS
jgi:hypothetical protein